MNKNLILLLPLFSGCFFDLSAIAPRDGGSTDVQVHDSGLDSADVLIADAFVDVGIDADDVDSGLDAGIDAFDEDGGTDSGHDGGVDAGRDAPTCDPLADTSAHIGALTCSGCVAWRGYSCEGEAPFLSCQIRCESDCECPSGTTCRPDGTGLDFCQF